MEVVPVKAALENKSGITFKGNGDGYLEAHRIIKLMTGTKGDRFIFFEFGDSDIVCEFSLC